MTRLSWDASGTRWYEAGVDRAVLYPRGGVGVAWNGLKSVKALTPYEKPEPRYVDGIRYANSPVLRGYGLTLEAFTYPEEFESLSGEAYVANGLTVTGQLRKEFDLCYRTGLGNDTTDYTQGYKIHLAYNAIVGPSDKNRPTIDSDVSPDAFSWDILCKPVQIPNMAPDPFFHFSSKTTSPTVLTAIENILYGTAGTNPRIPGITELLTIFGG